MTTTEKPASLLQLPAEILKLICEKYFEHDKLTIVSQQSNPNLSDSSIGGASSLSIELVCHRLSIIAKGVRARIWSQDLIINITAPQSDILVQLAERDGYRWLRKHTIQILLELPSPGWESYSYYIKYGDFVQSFVRAQSLHVLLHITRFNLYTPRKTEFKRALANLALAVPEDPQRSLIYDLRWMLTSIYEQSKRHFSILLTETKYYGDVAVWWTIHRVFDIGADETVLLHGKTDIVRYGSRKKWIDSQVVASYMASLEKVNVQCVDYHIAESNLNEIVDHGKNTLNHD